MQLPRASAFVLLLALAHAAQGARLLARRHIPSRSNMLTRWKGPDNKDFIPQSFHANELKHQAQTALDWDRSVRDGSLENVNEKTESEDKRTSKDIADQESLPCGSNAVPKNWEYLDRLMKGLCSLPTSAPECSSWTSHMECLFREFYTTNCQDVTSAPGDICQKCKDPMFMQGTSTTGSYFPLAIQQFFKKQESQSYSSAAAGEIVGKELMCGASMMVKDGCQGMTSNLPSCYK